MDSAYPIAANNAERMLKKLGAATNQSQKVSQGSKNALGRDSFLKLLVAELRHQDPTQPMNDKEFISQMAQFSSLEQMTEMNKSIKALTISTRSGEAYSLLGKGVEALDPITGKRVKGIVSKLFYRDNGVRLIVNGREIGLSDIHSIYIVQRPENISNGKASGMSGNSANVNHNHAKDINISNDTN